MTVRILRDGLAREGRDRQREGLARRACGVPARWRARRDQARRRPPREGRPSRCAGSRSAFPASSRTTASTSRRPRARSTRCSARTAPARDALEHPHRLYRPDEGEIALYGEPVEFHSPRDALDAGHRHGAPALPARRRRSPSPRTSSSATTAARAARSCSAARDRAPRRRAAASATASPSTRARGSGSSRVGEQQRVEILKALYREARDPDPRRADRGADAAGGRRAVRDAAGDGGRGADGDLHLAQAARGEGGRRPRHRAARRPLGRDGARRRTPRARSLAALMVGRELEVARRTRARARARRGRARGSTALCARGDRGVDAAARRLARRARRRDRRRRGRRRQRPARARRGDRRACGRPTRGHGRASAARRCAAAIRARRSAAGVAHVPEDRLRTGVAPSLSIASNVVLKSYRGARARRGAAPAPAARSATARSS